MKHIRDLLSKRVRESGLAGNIETALIIEEFDNLAKGLFGFQVQKKIKPVYIKNKILQLACLSPVVAQEIRLKKDYFISEINKKFKKELLIDIRFTL